MSLSTWIGKENIKWYYFRARFSFTVIINWLGRLKGAKYNMEAVGKYTFRNFGVGC